MEEAPGPVCRHDTALYESIRNATTSLDLDAWGVVRQEVALTLACRLGTAAEGSSAAAALARQLGIVVDELWQRYGEPPAPPPTSEADDGDADDGDADDDWTDAGVAPGGDGAGSQSGDVRPAVG